MWRRRTILWQKLEKSRALLVTHQVH